MLAAVDPGKTGAVVLFDMKGGIVNSHQFSVLKGQRFFNEVHVDQFLMVTGQAHYFVTEAILDRFSPKQSSIHANTTAVNFGIWYAQMLDLVGEEDIDIVQPKDWKRRMMLLGAQKDDSIDLALTLYPEMADALKYKKNHDLAEAILIGVDYLRRKDYIKE